MRGGNREGVVVRETEEMRQTKWEIDAYIAQLLSYRDAPTPHPRPPAPQPHLVSWSRFGELLDRFNFKIVFGSDLQTAAGEGYY